MAYSKTKKDDQIKPTAKLIINAKKLRQQSGSTQDFRLRTLSAKRVNNNYIILQYPISSIDAYYKKYVAPLSGDSFIDAFVFEKITSNGGTFIPASFWDDITK